ncbi:CGGC domain-containing protein [Inediibacterium massiliense]|uniref:CGGC domain-containing protein n=1 Tax=Inediibacterium massiliense TaxID=1658111 RepID=UPI0006B5459E|nr:CGGC domain-containing protein [Inediibacterium massiliense]
MNTKYVVMIQCDLAHRRCSGFACTNTFYKKEGKFEGYTHNVPYIAFTCGGCCGKGVAAKIEHFSRQLKKNADIKQEEVSIHLSSCMTTDNHHYDRCPHIDYIKNILNKKGFYHIIEGTYITKSATHLREKGVYKTY